MQQPTDQSVGQRKDIPEKYLDNALVVGQYKIYCPVMAFDLPTQNVTFAFDPPMQNVTFVYDTKLFKAGGSTNILVRFLSG